MYHSISFMNQPGRVLGAGDVNTWDDFHLIPSTRPSVSPPSPYIKLVEIPGRSGTLDMTDFLAPRPVYGDRSGSFTFRMDNERQTTFIENYENLRSKGYTEAQVASKLGLDIAGVRSTLRLHDPWFVVHERMLATLHGRQKYMLLEDDKDYYYRGRFTVSDWDSGNEAYSQVSINYQLEPYKRAIDIKEASFGRITGDTGVYVIIPLTGVSFPVFADITPASGSTVRLNVFGNTVSYSSAVSGQIIGWTNPIGNNHLIYGQSGSGTARVYYREARI